MKDALELADRAGAYAYKGRWRLPAFTSLGAYTLIYLTEGMDVLCADCATTDYLEWLYSLHNLSELWSFDPPLYVDTYDEGPDEICAGCNKPIPSSCGDPWEGKDNA